VKKVSLDHRVLLDPTEQELLSNASEAQVSVAYMPSRDQVNFVQASGDWGMHSFKEFMDTCLDGCKKMQPILRSCLVETTRMKTLA
jgi:exosome complex component MTR3